MKNIKISNLVKSLRKKMGLTQEQFAQKIGATFSSVNNWENGKNKLLKYYGIRHKYFYLYLKEFEFRFNNKNKDIESLLMDIVSKNKLFN